MLNGDIILWYDVLGHAFELSSMGIRVDDTSIIKQLKAKNEDFKLTNPYVKSVIEKTIPLTIGGGIGPITTMYVFSKKTTYW